MNIILVICFLILLLFFTLFQYCVKKRHIIENTFIIKNNKKLINNYESNTINFKQIQYLSFIILITNKYYKFSF